ncbi:cytochrome c biogenesis CcdA family protein [Falsibacillus pallidus]|uniref:cytochrome c biogenesis CcdA family protein n=1 Tax=Falsibacillus pallidus TaxID=493781 RepID=UPI003D97364C
MTEVSVWFAFGVGILSFFSPCIFPLIPAYISHLTGGQVKDGKVQVEKKLLLNRSIGFIIGFSIIFIIMGASATFLGELFSRNRLLIEGLAGLLIVVFGLQMAGVLQFSFLMKEKKVEGPAKIGSSVQSVFLGMAFASGWSPCVGLTLSSILLMASQSSTVLQGMWLLAVYSLGIAIPFLLLSFLLTKTLKLMKKISRWIPLMARVNGLLMVVLGILVFTGKMQQISAWLSAFTTF